MWPPGEASLKLPKLLPDQYLRILIEAGQDVSHCHLLVMLARTVCVCALLLTSAYLRRTHRRISEDYASI